MTAPDPAGYWPAVHAEDERLDATLAAIRADYDAGHLTIREAADSRVAALSAHQEACQAHRRTFLGEDDPEHGLERIVRHALAEHAAEVYPDPDPERDRLQPAQWSAEWVRATFPAWSVVLEDGQTWLAQRMSGHGPQLRAATLGLLVETINDWLRLERDRAAEARGVPAR